METDFSDVFRKAASQPAHNPRDRERVKEMRRLRDNGATIAAIGEIFGVSRERVRQLIGNTGRKSDEIIRLERQRIIDTNRDLTTPELEAKMGIKISGHGKRNYHHPIAGDNSCSRGNIAETMAAELLRKHGFGVELMPLHHPFDILVNGSIRVDVKAASNPSKSPSIISRTISPMWRFRVKQNTRHKCDFYFLLIAETQDVFIVPSKDVPDKRDTLAFCYPTERPELAKWQNYHDAYDLIEEKAQDEN